MSGAIQAGQRAAVEVLAELCPTALTHEEQESVQRSQTGQSPPTQTQSSKLAYLSTGKVMVVTALTIGAALLLAQHQNALLKAKAYLMNAFSTQTL